MSPFHPTLWHLSHNLLDNNAVSAPRHWTLLAPDLGGPSIQRPHHSVAPLLGGPTIGLDSPRSLGPWTWTRPI